MANLQYNTLFMLFMLILGIVLIYVGWNVDTSLKDCTSNSVKVCSKLVLVLGSALIAFSLAYFRCASSCETKDYGMAVYLIITALLGIFLIVIGSIITAGSHATLCQNKNANVVWIIGVVMLLSSSFVIWQNLEVNPKLFKSLTKK